MVGIDRKSKDNEVRELWETAVHFPFKLFNSFAAF